jgi:hypothetical protein
MSREQQCAMKCGTAIPLILVPLAALIAASPQFAAAWRIDPHVPRESDG